MAKKKIVLMVSRLFPTTLTDENRQIDWRLLAKNDGLNERDFREWFFGRSPQRSKTFHGVIIHFTPFRY
jgi:hypothetical protein